MATKYKSIEFYNRIDKIDKLWKALHELSLMAEEFGIDDIFQDNGAKVLQQIIYLNFDILPGREGNDAKSQDGHEWEMKSLNIQKVKGFSTNHHTNFEIISKYRKVSWSFAIYKNIHLYEIYVMSPKALEPFFRKWEEKLRSDKKRTHLNNPKIPLKFVQENGILVYSNEQGNIIDPITAIKVSANRTTDQ